VPRVRVEPSGIEFESQLGEPIMVAGERAGLRWPTVCGGQGTCRVCFFTVPDELASRLSPVSRYEGEGLAELHAPTPPGTHARLACQAEALDDLAITKRGVRVARPRTSVL
jgi:2Fe-2S ferredoxin